MVLFFILSIRKRGFVVKWNFFMNYTVLEWKIVRENNRNAEFSFSKLNETEFNRY